jgi:hypothetical protein
MKLFISYSHIDESLREALEKHLSLLKNQGLIDLWQDRKIALGQEFATTIDRNLSGSQIIILLISSDFIASPYCYGIEMTRAMELHDSGAARVIPVILRACDWHSAPFGKLLAAPTDGRPVKSWPDIDEAFYNVTRQIRAAVDSFNLTPSNPLEPLDVAKVYCTRCGALAGSQSLCTGAYMHHSFARSGRFGTYCSRCGEIPGEKTLCTGAFTHHDFVEARGPVTFCGRCGVLAGKKTMCTGAYIHHEFSA